MYYESLMYILTNMFHVYFEVHSINGLVVFN